MHYTTEELDEMAARFVMQFLSECELIALPLSLQIATHYASTGKTVEWAIKDMCSRKIGLGPAP